jgi:hypothetical protein
MAETARRRPDLEASADPRLNDPVNPLPSAGSTAETDPRYRPANQDPRVDNRTVVTSRGAGSGVIIAAIVVALAIIAYFAFAPDTATVPPVEPSTSAPASPPDATAPSTPAPATPAPDATAPAAPSTPATPQPDATAPAAPATPAPAEPAPAPAAPASPN